MLLGTHLGWWVPFLIPVDWGLSSPGSDIQAKNSSPKSFYGPAAAFTVLKEIRKGIICFMALTLVGGFCFLSLENNYDCPSGKI